MFDSKKEVALDTLNLSELILQFKLMKALGYKSLFDPEFRRELKNPFRKRLYYKILMSEEALDRKLNMDFFRNQFDRLSFFSDPTLYRKVKESEEKEAMENPELNSKKVKEIKEKYGSKVKKYTAPNEEDQKRASEMLAGIRPGKSFLK